jgi:hypothetical protein
MGEFQMCYNLSWLKEEKVKFEEKVFYALQLWQKDKVQNIVFFDSVCKHIVQAKKKN